MTPDPSRLNHPATPLSAPWTAEQAQTHHSPTPDPDGAANEGNEMSTESSRESLVRTIEDLQRVIRKRNGEISALRMECRDLARELAEAKPAPRPLAVGDRVRVVKPEYASATRVSALAVGDVGEVTELADDDGDIGFHRDGTEGGWCVAAANVERIEDEPLADGAVTAREWHAPDFTKETNR